ncbi:hypothetical protein J1605_017420 [Eschrichtius robustus]|uniref:Small ribosomal subunit protein uS7 domain-containing protein n=1 Tax=Eschrichtius robustus TaxID=9764 RepID=A0AB34HWI5_ESCRO|nr:hypothetical protein J1605_017420 [Eschrichtius robustus]
MTEWETAAPAVAETPNIKLFGKWSTDDDYVAVKEKYAKYPPHSVGRYAAKCVHKAQCPIVERLTNAMMMHGHNNGKKLVTVRITKQAFESIHLLTGENPLQLLAIWLLCTGAREATFRNIKTIAECLADELISAAKGSSNSYAIKKKDELERVAKFSL